MMLVSVTVKEVANKMVRHGTARNRSHTFNVMIREGLSKVLEKVRCWDHVYNVEEYEGRGYRVRHGGLSKILEEVCSR